MSTFNILNIDIGDLKIVVDAYNQGKSDFFIAGKKYWLNNLFEIKIFEFDHPDKFDAFIEFAKSNNLFVTGMFNKPHLTPQVLQEGGKEVTRDFIKNEYGAAKDNSETQDSNINHQMEIFVQEMENVSLHQIP